MADQPGSQRNAPLFNIPSFREVQQAQGPTGGMGNLFQPKGLVSAYRDHQQQQAVQQPPVMPQGPRQPLPPAQPPFARLPPAGAGPSAGAPPAAVRVGGLPTYIETRNQQQQQQQPGQQRPAAHQGNGGGAPSTGASTGGSLGAQAAGGPPPAGTSAPGGGAAAAAAAQAMMGAGTAALVVSKRQQGNPLLKHIRNVRWVYGDIGPDYLLGANACALFLSLRYHLLHPDYISYRIKELQRAYALRVLLVQVDVEDVVKPLGDITKAAVMNDCTLVCAWSAEEAARYLETFKAYETKPASGIQERVEGDYTSRLASALTAVRGVNRTDALTLGSTLGSLANILAASPEVLSGIPGLGPTKVSRLVDAFKRPLRKVVDASQEEAEARAPAPAPAPPAAGVAGAAAMSTDEPTKPGTSSLPQAERQKQEGLHPVRLMATASAHPARAVAQHKQGATQFGQAGQQGSEDVMSEEDEEGEGGSEWEEAGSEYDSEYGGVEDELQLVASQMMTQAGVQGASRVGGAGDLLSLGEGDDLGSDAGDREDMDDGEEFI